MQPVSTAVMHTLCYADVFDYPLTVTEIHERLIAASPVSLKAVKPTLEKLHTDGTVCRTGPYYHLPKRSRLIKLRAERMRYADAKTRRAAAIARHLIRLPYVEAIFLTGAVAVRNAPANDDIDILVVTAPHSLWSCRVFVNLWLDANKLRRHPKDKTVSDKICPNLFLTTDSLTVPPGQQNLYTAHEVTQVKPLVDPLNIYAQFIAANGWVSHYLGNQPATHPAPGATAGAKKHNLSPFVWETAVRKLQYLYMYSKITRETVTNDTAYFHPRDTAGIVLAKYRQRVAKYE